MGEKYDIQLQPSCFTLTVPDNMTLVGSASITSVGDGISVWTGDTANATKSAPFDWSEYLTVDTTAVPAHTISCTGVYESYNSVCDGKEGILRTNRKRVALRFI